MKRPITEREIWLSILFAILLLPFAFLLNRGMEWFCNNVVLSLFNWFNRLNIFLKIFILIVGGLSIFFLILSLFRMIGNFLSYLIFNKLPENLFTIIYSSVVFLINVTFAIIALWKSVGHFSFWVVCEFILLVVFILSANTILMPWYRREMMKLHREERNIYKNDF